MTLGAHRDGPIRLLVAGTAATAAVLVLGADRSLAVLAVLATATALGELLDLRTEGGAGLPVSNAVMLVVAAGTTESRAAVTLASGVAAAALVWRRGAGGRWRVGDWLVRTGSRAVTAAVTIGLYTFVFARFGEETPTAVLVSLAAALVGQVTVAELMRAASGAPSGLGPRGRLAWLALGSSGILMAVGYRGIDGEGELGLWAVLMFGIPLMAAWYAFDRYDSASRTHLQTIDALSRAPELGGLVRDGHAGRVAALCAEMAVVLGLDEEARAQLDTAAKLHHLGVVTLDDPAVAGGPHPAALVADVTAAMLGEIERLAPAARIVAAGPLPQRRPGGGAGPDMPSMILKVASDFDDLTDGEPSRSAYAVEALYSGPGYVYDTTVLIALERVLEARGVLPALVPVS